MTSALVSIFVVVSLTPLLYYLLCPWDLSQLGRSGGRKYDITVCVSETGNRYNWNREEEGLYKREE